MRVMVIVKADKDSEAGVLPGTELFEEMGKFNEELAKAGVLLAGFWLWRVKSMAEAIDWLQRPLQWWDGGGDPAGVRGRGLRCGVHPRAEGARGAAEEEHASLAPKWHCVFATAFAGRPAVHGHDGG